MNRSIAVMQPYFLPYIGYFQLINAVKRFVIYDDVNFIKRGWINRNRILINGKIKYFTLPCSNASQNKKIYEVQHLLDTNNKIKLLRMIKYSYAKAPFFNEIYPIVQKILEVESKYIADIAIKSIFEVVSYLELECSFSRSSIHYNNANLSGAERLADICITEGICNYINLIGGQKIYTKEFFEAKGINLNFLKPGKIVYQQFSDSFSSDLSILDVLMFNGKNKTRGLLSNFKLI